MSGTKSKICPKCSAEHPVNAAYCGCGHTWRKQADAVPDAVFDPMHGCCQWSSGGKRCHYAGVVNTSTAGGGRWLCMAHDGCGDALLGSQIVDQSHVDVPSPDYSHAAIRERSDAEHAKMVHAWMKERGLAWNSSVMSNHEHADMLREICHTQVRVLVSRANVAAEVA